MAKSNKFGFAPLETEPPQRRERSVGPMGAAVREAAESLTDATEAGRGAGSDVAGAVADCDGRSAARPDGS